MASRTKPAGGSTVDEAEVVRFSARAAEWWDPRGEMAMLHRFNPVRLAFIKQAACRRFGREERRLDALAGLRVLDIGCGGGILSEPLAHLGAAVVGADPSPANIEAALERHGLAVIDETGVVYNLLSDCWQLASDMDVNYMVVAERAPS